MPDQELSGPEEQDRVSDSEVEESTMDSEDDAAQEGLDQIARDRRARDSQEVTENEAANYARNHAIIERDEHGNPIETQE